MHLLIAMHSRTRPGLSNKGCSPGSPYRAGLLPTQHPTPRLTSSHLPSRRFSSQRLACCSLAFPSTCARARLPTTQMAFNQGHALRHCACASTGPHMRGPCHTLASPACKARVLCCRRSLARADFAQRPSTAINFSGAGRTPSWDTP